MDRTELDEMIDDALAPDLPELHAWLEAGAHAEDHDGGAIDPPEWTIDGERTATWALRRLRRAEAEVAAAEAHAAELRRVADEYVERVKGRTQRHIDYFTGRLRHYHDQVLAENPKAKTLELPGARLKRRAGGVTTEVEDADALRAWLEDHDAEDLLEYPDPRIAKTGVKSRYGAKVSAEPGAYPAVDDATGEVLPGVRFVRGEPSEIIEDVTTEAEA